MKLFSLSKAIGSEQPVLGDPPPPPPVLTGISPGTGTTAGGTSVTLEGLHLIDTTSVTFDGVTASFEVDSDEQITATSPAHSAAGGVLVVVTTPDGSTSIGYEYVSVTEYPATQTMKAWFRDYLAEGWNGTASIGTSGARSMGVGAFSPPDLATNAINGYNAANFQGANEALDTDFVIGANGANKILPNAYAGMVLCKIRSISTNEPTAPDNDAILGGGYSWGLYLRNDSGTPKVMLFHNSGGGNQCEAVIPLNEWIAIQWKYTNGIMFLGVNGQWLGSVDAEPIWEEAYGQVIQLGHGDYSDMDGEIAEVMMTDTMTPERMSGLMGYFNDRYAQSFYQSWDPAEPLSPRLFVRGSFSSLPWLNEGYSVGINLTAGEAESPSQGGEQLNDYVPCSFNGAGQLLRQSSDEASSFFSTEEYAGWILMFGFGGTNNPEITDNTPIFTMGTTGLYYKQGTLYLVHHGDVVYSFTSVDIENGLWHLIQFRFLLSGTTLQIRANGGSWHTAIPGPSVGFVDGDLTLRVAANAAEDLFAEMMVMEFGLNTFSYNDQSSNLIRQYNKERYLAVGI